MVASLSSADKEALTAAIAEAAKPILQFLDQLATRKQRMQAASLASGIAGASADTIVSGAEKIMEFVASNLAADAILPFGKVRKMVMFGENNGLGLKPQGVAFTAEISDNRIVIQKGDTAPNKILVAGPTIGVGMMMVDHQIADVVKELRQRFWGLE